MEHYKFPTATKPIALIIVFLSTLCSGQQFTEISTSLTALDRGAVTWGDYDNDGDLDILITGSTSSAQEDKYSKIYQNNGNSTFTLQSTISLVGVNSSSVAWGDYDNDGYIDILLCGYSTTAPVTMIYHNNGLGNFTDSGISITGVYEGDVAWADYDNDGDLDFIVTGIDVGTIRRAIIYKNNGGGTFEAQSTPEILGVNYSSVDWGDYDNDGDHDLIISGYNSSEGRITRLYKNTAGSFTHETSIALHGVDQGDVVFGDYNSDGFLDILLIGYDGATGRGILKIYKNDGVGDFDLQSSIITGETTYYFYNGKVAFGDVDNDGDLDFIVSGYDYAGYTKLFINNGNNTFTYDNTTSLEGAMYSSVALGDFDNDSDLDLLLTGYSLITKLYRNNCSTSNLPPTAPIGLNTVRNGNSLTFSWNKSTDDHTNQNGLTYNLYIGTTSSGVEKKSPSYGLSDGFRRIVQLGNVGHTNSITISNLPEGTYYWGVQAIDNSFSGSYFVDPFTDQTDISITGVAAGSTAWADFDNDDDLDFIISGSNLGNRVSKIYRNNGNGSFTERADIVLTGVSYSSIALGDYNNDNNVDILLTGYDGTSNISKIYKNNGDDSFSLEESAVLTGVSRSSVAWGDYDLDGYQDILVTGYGNGGAKISKIYKNNGDNTFTEQTDISLPGVIDGSVAWSDYNNDGYPDILLCGESASGRISKIYKNNRDNSFTDQTSISFTGVSYSSCDWGDYDNDGDLDIIICGSDGTNRKSKIYKNNGNNTFSEQSSTTITASSFGSVKWGDYDNDGDLDILLTGDDSTGEPIAEVYTNNGNGSFSENLRIQLTPVQLSSVAWGDYDNDGDLDLLLTGSNENMSVSKIYKNNTAVVNTAPTAPTNLSVSINENSVTFSWDKSTDTQTSQNGLTYNLQIGTSSRGVQTKTAMSNTTNGYRRLVQLGNVYYRNSITITLPEIDTYYWSVQAIDNNFAGSAFSTENSFTNSPFEQITSFSTGITNSSCDWGDYDNDGDLDLIIIGQDVNWSSNLLTKVYKNSGNGSFTHQSDISLPAVCSGSVKWGDFDRDGDLDLAISGRLDYDGVERITRIYRNDSNNIFTNINANLTGVSESSICWADFDNDGDLDLIIVGRSGSNVTDKVAKIYKNDSGVFSDANCGLTADYDCGLSCADFDNDKDIDIIIGFRCYKNNGNLTFTSNGSIESNQSIAAGDIDGDGDIDLASTGNRYTYLYTNNGNGIFSKHISTLIELYNSHTAFGDYDCDGDLDLLVTGYLAAPDTGPTTKLYKNSLGGTVFLEKSNTGLDDIGDNAHQWADIDDDGDLDVLLSGNKLYRNQFGTVNSAPSVPTNLSASTNGHIVTLLWDKSTDEQTSQNGLTYNIRIGTSSGSADVMTASSSSTTGMYKLVSIGNTCINNGWKIILTTRQTYYWSVQAIDNCYKSSTFSSEGTFTITEGMELVNITTNASSYRGTVSWGDYENDNDLDILFGINSLGLVTQKYTQIIRNNGNDNFVDVELAYNFGTSTEVSLPWIDMNGDNKLDIIQFSNKYLFYNQGDGTFSNNWMSSGFQSPNICAYGDFDNDGDIDIVGDGGNYHYKNDGSDPQNNIDLVLTRLSTDLPFLSMSSNTKKSSFNCGDYDNDGDLDILATGLDLTASPYYLPLSKVYQNNGNGTFTEQSTISLTGVINGSAVWGDYNNDGYLDIALAGESGGEYFLETDTDPNTVPILKIYKNNGNGTFTDIGGSFTGIEYCALAWSDYDNDGDLDLAASGSETTKIYRNTGNDQFSEVGISLIGLYWVSSLVWGDYDYDGDLDLLLSGIDSGND